MVDSLDIVSNICIFNSLFKDEVNDDIDYKEQIFPIPNVVSLEDFVNNVKISDPKLYQFHKGTTTLSFIYQGGIIVAVDSRASMGTFIASQSVKKVMEINDMILGTIAGGAADCTFWQRHLSKMCRLFELRHQKPISVAAASKILCNIFYHYRRYGLACGTMIIGYDNRGPQIYFVEDSGIRLNGKMFSIGSGSTHAYGIIDSGYRYDMLDEEAIELGRRAICHAAHRDAGSGGKLLLYHVHKNGYKKIYDGEDLSELFYKYSERQVTDMHIEE